MPASADHDGYAIGLVDFCDSSALAKSTRANAIISTTSRLPPLIRQFTSTFSRLKLNQAALVSGGDRLGSTHHVQLREDASHVRLHGGFADKKIRAYFLVASAASKQLKHIDFTSRQCVPAHPRRQLGPKGGGNAGFPGMHFS